MWHVYVEGRSIVEKFDTIEKALAYINNMVDEAITWMKFTIYWEDVRDL